MVTKLRAMNTDLHPRIEPPIVLRKRSKQSSSFISLYSCYKTVLSISESSATHTAHTLQTHKHQNLGRQLP
jgi:ribosomal protein L31